jgi:hypothetical protein
MANGTLIRPVDLVAHRAYQEQLVRLMRSLTAETIDGGEVRLKAAMTDTAAFDAIVKFRRAHGLQIVDCDPLYYVAGLHRARIRHPAMTRAEVNWSEHWLIRRGLRCEVDTEFNPKPETKQ